MAKLDLAQYGIKDVKRIIHNPSYEELFKDETNPELKGYEKGILTDLGAVDVFTGEYTGRSPKDKYLVKDEVTENTVWWTSDEYKNDNKPITTEVWNHLKESFPTRLFMSLTAIAAPTRQRVSTCASSWKWHGRPIS